MLRLANRTAVVLGDACTTAANTTVALCPYTISVWVSVVYRSALLPSNALLLSQAIKPPIQTVALGACYSYSSLLLVSIAIAMTRG